MRSHILVQCACLWAFYMFPQLTCLFCCRKYVDRSWEYENRSQTHESGNSDWGRAIPRKGIQKWDFRCSVLCTGCRSSPRQTSPMLVNKIDTGVICGTAGKRPLQLIFPPASGQAAALCGPRILLHRRNGPGFFSFDYVLPGQFFFTSSRDTVLLLTNTRKLHFNCYRFFVRHQIL